MPYDNYLLPLDTDRIRQACIDKTSADPEQAGFHISPKVGRVALNGWRSKLFCHAADRSATILAYQAEPLVVGVPLRGELIPFPIDFGVATRVGNYLVVLDIPGLEPDEHAWLLGMVASRCRFDVVNVTDSELNVYARTGRFFSPAAEPVQEDVPANILAPSRR